jgi:hypothetical protein
MEIATMKNCAQSETKKIWRPATLASSNTRKFRHPAALYRQCSPSQHHSMNSIHARNENYEPDLASGFRLLA